MKNPHRFLWGFYVFYIYSMKKRKIKPYLCKCGETNPGKFIVGYKGICRKCLYKRRLENYHNNKKPRVYKEPICSTCGETDRNNFYRRHKSICKLCSNKQRARRIKDQHKHYLKTLFSRRLSSAKRRALKYGMPFNLTKEYLEDLLDKQNNKCVYSGKEFVLNSTRNLSPSLDRIIPEKGYVQGNVQWVCSSVNMAKGALSEDEFFKLIKSIHDHCELG